MKEWNTVQYYLKLLMPHSRSYTGTKDISSKSGLRVKKFSNCYLIVRYIISLVLIDELKFWHICYDYLIFKTEEGDEHSDKYQLINLAKKNATLMIEAKFNECNYSLHL
jgi:hypothetical protein